MSKEDNVVEPHLEIYTNKSVLVSNPKEHVVFEEGSQTENAKRRFTDIKKKLEEGFLDNVIEECKKPDISLSLSDVESSMAFNLVSGITSDVGRALVGLSIVQLCIKVINPRQSIRLHKGGHGDFSWKEGISMRSLDRELIAPTLRRYRLIMYNKDGVMMTRSLAENYPYSSFYKAALRGPKIAWLNLVETLENQPARAYTILKKIIVLLINRSKAFQVLTDNTISNQRKFLLKKPDPNEIKKLIWEHVRDSQYPARLFEISIHSLFQALKEMNMTKFELRPLSQMRSANKKAGNIGDIEIIEKYGDEEKIVVAWDAKYGKSYLYDELAELESKLTPHAGVKEIGFIISGKADIRKEIREKLIEIHDEYDVEVSIIDFDTFVSKIFKEHKGKEVELSERWLVAYTESLCLKRIELAPIEEPAEEWVKSLSALFAERI